MTYFYLFFIARQHADSAILIYHLYLYVCLSCYNIVSI